MDFLPPLEYNGGKPWTDKDIEDFISFENGNKLIWDGCSERLLAAKKVFELEIKLRGWVVRYTSALRSFVYQAHLHDISKGPASKTAAGRVHAQSHGIRESGASYPNRASSPHILGVAFDAVVTANGRALNPAGAVINADLHRVALSCGFKTPPANDTVHFEISVR